jgi:tRNA pseudouridine32 synthase/23S rRNA pseudouridine746 synthase
LKFELHLTVTTPTTAIALLSSQCQLSINALKQAVVKGALWLEKGHYTKRFRRLKKSLQVGDILHFYYDENILNQQVNAAKLIADEGCYSLWYKPYGMLSQGSKWSDHCTINRWVETHLEPLRPAFIVHRLDRAASGLIVIAHSKIAAKALCQLFEQHNLNKIYHIICHGDHRLRPQPDVITVPIDGKKANSTFTCLQYYPQQNMSLIEVNIGSGRKHQIRKHAASIGYPVVGDRLHGDKNQVHSTQINLQLCAVSLSFYCPLTNTKRQYQVDNTLMPSIEKIENLAE